MLDKWKDILGLQTVQQTRESALALPCQLHSRYREEGAGLISTHECDNERFK